MHILHKSIPNQIFPNANYTLFLGKIQSSSLKAEAVFIVALTSTLVTTIVSLCLNFPLHRAFPLTTCARTGTKKKYLASGAFVSGYNSSLSVDRTRASTDNAAQRLRLALLHVTYSSMTRHDVAHRLLIG